MHDKTHFLPSLRSSTSQLGFTLIELMVTITVMLVLTGGAIASYITFRDRQAVSTAAREAQSMFVAAQKKATSRQVPAGVANCVITGAETAADSTFRGYRATVAAGSIAIRAICGTTNAGAADAGTTETFTLPNGVTASATGTNPVRFYSLHEGTNIPAGGTTTVTIQNTAGTVSNTFTINSSGAISEVN